MKNSTKENKNDSQIKSNRFDKKTYSEIINYKFHDPRKWKKLFLLEINFSRYLRLKNNYGILRTNTTSKNRDFKSKIHDLCSSSNNSVLSGKAPNKHEGLFIQYLLNPHLNVVQTNKYLNKESKYSPIKKIN